MKIGYQAYEQKFYNECHFTRAKVNDLLILFSIISFLVFGSACLCSKRMRTEFARYGIPHYRKITGLLQLLGALGLMVGVFLPVAGLLAAAGLASLMFLGTVLRIRIQDTFIQTLPAIIYMLLSSWLVVHYARILF